MRNTTAHIPVQPHHIPLWHEALEAIRRQAQWRDTVAAHHGWY